MDPRIMQYLENAEPWQRRCFEAVRQCLLTLHPGIEERFSYMCPFYFFKGPLFYFSIQKKGSRTLLGFVHGNKMDPRNGLMQAPENQAQVRQFIFSENEIPDPYLLRELLLEAIDINEKLSKL